MTATGESLKPSFNVIKRYAKALRADLVMAFFKAAIGVHDNIVSCSARVNP
ncbi:unnamed protein product, partial [Rotaria sp. Silwood2]